MNEYNNLHPYFERKLSEKQGGGIFLINNIFRCTITILPWIQIVYSWSLIELYKIWREAEYVKELNCCEFWIFRSLILRHVASATHDQTKKKTRQKITQDSEESDKVI